ncbi:inositol oxygenase family protein [Silvibacterium sp.]|uniref:inositol oxygenase family protein n=1 Tax=Silvibacterium sp. TaxID=1964179 RepID=UPI0039E68EAF
MSSAVTTHEPASLPIEDQWEEFVAGRYKEGKDESEYRIYDEKSDPRVAAFYRENHQKQTLAFVLEKEKEYYALNKGERSIWEAAEYLNTLVDESDPDTDLNQIEHLMQTSEAIRRDGHPRWMILAGFLHDLGKCLCLYGEPQWAVVGDTFPVGCAYSDKVVFPEYFRANPDYNVPELQTQYGIYEPNCGLDKVHMSFGHDGYIAHVVRDYMPEPALYMLRYHSFYAAHRQGAYGYLMSPHDIEMFEWVRKFNPYDLYSKGHTKPDVKALRPYYEDLIAEFFPAKLRW